MHHTVVNSAVCVTATETDLTPITDGPLTIQNGHWLPPQDLPIWYAAAMATNLQRARFSSGTLRIPTTPYIRPITNALIPNDPMRFANYQQNPLTARMQEELSILGIQNAGANQRITTVLGFGINFQPSPIGNIFSMRGTSTTAAVANTWTMISPTWQDTIAQGTYAIIGLDHQSANAQAARCYILNQYWRPGIISTPGLGDKGDEFFRRGGLGVWGTFTANYLPNIEVCCNAADAAHEVYLYFVRIAGAPLYS